MTNKRRHERFEADIPVRLFIEGKKGLVFEAFLRTRDLSFGGAFVKSEFHFKDDPDLMCELKLPDEDIPVRARIVRKVDGGMGIAFDEMPWKSRQALLRHFVPDEHRAFHKNIEALMPNLGLDRVSMILHLWEEWRASPRAKIESTFTSMSKSNGETRGARGEARESARDSRDSSREAPRSTSRPSVTPKRR